MHIKKGDKVKVISGKDKGKSGVVLRALPKEGKVVVEGIAMAKRHMRGVFGAAGRIAERAMPIDASNVALAESKKSKSVLDAK